MIEEIGLFGVYMPAALGWAVVAGGMTAVLRPVLRLPGCDGWCGSRASSISPVSSACGGRFARLPMLVSPCHGAVMTLPRNFVRFLTGLVMFGLMGAAITSLWMRYQVEPVTRDGKVRADTVAIAPDVAGLVSETLVHDNQQVKRGQVLFVIDQARYRLALEQAEGQLRSQQVALAQAEREDRRNRTMTDVVAAEAIEEGRAHVDTLRAGVVQAASARDLARVNLTRTQVRAPVDGTVTNLNLQPGLWLAAGKPALALVYDRSLRVEGYFEETKLPAVRVGDPVTVTIMGVADEIRGTSKASPMASKTANVRAATPSWPM
jgi:multidrug resistance efflux pump